MLSAYPGEHIAVSNHAHSGLTTESFRSEGHYEILHERIQAGDVCLIQFGHNDQKLMHLLAEGGYRDNLIRYIDELREKGAIPVLVTPLVRNSWRGAMALTMISWTAMRGHVMWSVRKKVCSPN